MFDFLRKQWDDIKGNAKWDLIKCIVGGGVVATAYVLIRASSVYWKTQIAIFAICAVLFVLISAAQRTRRKAGLSTVQNLSDWRSGFSSPRFEVVEGYSFRNTTIEIDGKLFRGCTFENVTFMFRGIAPAEFEAGNQMSGGFAFATDDPAAALYSKWQRFARRFPSSRIEEGPYDKKGNLIAESFGIAPVEPEEPGDD